MAESKAAPIDPKLNPLTSEDLQDLKTAKSALGDVISSIEAAEQCGIASRNARGAY